MLNDEGYSKKIYEINISDDIIIPYLVLFQLANETIITNSNSFQNYIKYNSCVQNTNDCTTTKIDDNKTKIWKLILEYFKNYTIDRKIGKTNS